MDLPTAKELVLQYYNHASLHGVDDETLDKLRTFNVQVDMMMAVLAPPQVAGPGPVGQPIPSPQSDLMPQVPTA